MISSPQRQQRAVCALDGGCGQSVLISSGLRLGMLSIEATSFLCHQIVRTPSL
jgi:hypothetical protein